MKESIDIVIPSFRLEEKYILPILLLQRPIACNICFYLVVDNPLLTPAPAITELVDNKSVFLLINQKNEGASATRDKGIAAGTGNWILFLDDDIIVPGDLLLQYENAITLYPGEIGFIGSVSFPDVPSVFTRAMIQSGALAIFSIAIHNENHSWGPTANFLVNRKAAGDATFSSLYPKSGGGEDVDFFFQVRERNNRRNFKSLPNVSVMHPWWHDGKRQLKRFFRYGTGNALLPKRFPAFRYFDFPNITEIHVLSIIALLIALAGFLFSPLIVLLFLVISVLFEFLFTWIDNFITNKDGSLAIAVELFLIRYATNAGYWYANWFIYKKPVLFERFNFVGRPYKSFQLNKRKIMKGIFYIAAIVLLLTTTCKAFS